LGDKNFLLAPQGLDQPMQSLSLAAADEPDQGQKFAPVDGGLNFIKASRSCLVSK
jgi:hypothetical protein